MSRSKQEHLAADIDGSSNVVKLGDVTIRYVHSDASSRYWNAGSEVSVCLMVLAPPRFEAYFRELSAGLANVRSADEAIELRHRLSASYDIEVVGPRVQAS